MGKLILMTGATGFLGSNLVSRILREDEESKLIVLVRGESDGEASERLLGMLRLVAPEALSLTGNGRLQALRGDITHDQLGLPESHYHKLTGTVTHVIHSAANVRFQLPIEEARTVNVDGTRNLVSFARAAAANGQLHRVAYVSTAYVSGMRTGRICEKELDCNQQFGNTYEQSKFEAECYLRELTSELPITIFRPSIIVGDSRTGRTTVFNVLYGPLKLIYRRLLRVLPGSRKTPLDVVPVDYVSDAICHIFLKTNEGIGETFHLTAGDRNASTTGEVVDLAVDYFNGTSADVQIPPVKFMPLAVLQATKKFFHVRAQRILEAMEVYIPYLCIKRDFDDTNTRHALHGTSIAPQPFRLYHETILRFCLEADWGKRLRIVA